MKSAKTLFGTSVILVMLITSVRFTFTVKAAANVETLSHMGYLDSFGCYRVTGEIQNVGDQAVNSVAITATFYNSSNAAIETRFDLTMLHVILMSRKSPFEIALLDVMKSAEVDHYELNVSFSTTDPIPKGLKILDHSSFVDEMQCMHITGEIKNIGAEKATNVKVIATYYSSTGDAVAAALTYLDPEGRIVLGPNQTATFEIVLDEDRTSLVYEYKLVAESNQYACVMENEFLPTDLNKDGIVNILDIAIVASAFRSRPGDPGWNPDADLDGNEIINIIDIAAVAIDFGKTV